MKRELSLGTKLMLWVCKTLAVVGGIYVTCPGALEIISNAASGLSGAIKPAIDPSMACKGYIPTRYPYNAGGGVWVRPMAAPGDIPGKTIIGGFKP